MQEQQNKINKIRHSLAHIMASVVQELYPDVKFGIGPAIENGFYYDFALPAVASAKAGLSDTDLPKIEAKMRELLEQDIKFTKREITKAEAKKLFANQPYKLDLIEELTDPRALLTNRALGSVISIYQTGDFTDLCAGPHVRSTKEINPKAFKLTRIAGAYWRGSEKNPMLTRIYGVAFAIEKELKNYLKQQEEAEKRDHRKIGAKLDLFSFHDQAPGMPFFHPKGVIVYQELKNFWLKAQKEFNYDMVLCPSVLDVAVWKQSGHWDHYKDDMFFTKAEKGEKQFALRPMDCPGAIIIYNNALRSYKNLPLRYAEPGLITRKEKSGQLGGLFRVQQFTQDDAHIFITEEQIESEIKNVIKLVNKIYKPFGLEYTAYLSTRPDDFMGDIKTWDKAEAALKKILNDVYGKNWGLKEKDGAFYGPKIDYQLKDCLDRTWQCATIQLDFQMPLKFNCKYIDKKGKEKTPVLIHRTIMGSFERFIGILLEHYAGALPFWLSPEQIWIIPVGSRHKKYAQKIGSRLEAGGWRIKIKDENETVAKKIREAELQKIPYMVIVGDKEVKNKTINVRFRDKKVQKEITIKKFLQIMVA